MHATFDRWAELYDAIYRARGKDYAREAASIADVVTGRLQRPVRSVLDVGCGTGEHLRHLLTCFNIERGVGVDQSEAMLRIARRKLPRCSFFMQDMTALRLDETFDVICCLFASICYLPNADAMRQAVNAMAKHLSPDGVLLIEPGVTADHVGSAEMAVVHIDEPGLKLERRASARVRGHALEITFEFDVAQPAGIGAFTQYHHLQLFSLDEYRAAMREAGLEPEHDPRGPAGRGLFIARKHER